MQCPKCKSDNTQRLSVIYRSGTQSIITTSSTSGTVSSVGFSYVGGYGVGSVSGTTTTRGMTQSYLAQMASPPEKKSYKTAIVFAALLLFNFWLRISFTLFLPLSVLAAFFAYRSASYNRNKYPVKMQAWSKSWYCNKCSEIYIDELAFYPSNKQF